MELGFGQGSLWAISTVDNTGATVATPTPIKFGILQEFSFDIDFSIKELHGRLQIPIALARGSAKVTWKAKWAQINALMFHTIFLGNPALPTTPALTVDDSESHQIPAPSGPYTVTVTNAATFKRDLGVRVQSTNDPLNLVTSVTAAGQYSVNTGTGVYTFHSGDASKLIWIDYQHQPATTPGYQTSVVSQLMGNSPSFVLIARTTFTGAPLTLKLNQCISSKLTVARKNEDWVMPEMDGDAFTDSSGVVGYFSMNAAV